MKKDLDRSKNTINQIDYILEKLFGVRHDTVDTPDEFEKILTEKARENISDFLSTEPIKVADMLINELEKKKMNEAKDKRIKNENKGIFCLHEFNEKQKRANSELRQIAEHLLVYCNHHGEVEE